MLAGFIARAAVYVFYQVDRAGLPPAAGGLILLPNHPNALLDPALIRATSGRDIRFLAKSTLFTGLLGPLVRVVRSIQPTGISREPSIIARVTHQDKFQYHEVWRI